MSKMVYIKRKEGGSYRGGDIHYLRDVKNIEKNGEYRFLNSDKIAIIERKYS